MGGGATYPCVSRESRGIRVRRRRKVNTRRGGRRRTKQNERAATSYKQKEVEGRAPGR